MNVLAPNTRLHRDPVVALDGKVLGYTLTLSVADGEPAGPAVTTAAVPRPEPSLQAQYLALDLPNLVADRYVFLPATPEMLDGFVPEAPSPGRLVLELPRGFERAEGAGAWAAALRGLGIGLALPDYQGEPAQDALLPSLAFVMVDLSRPETRLEELVQHVHSLGLRMVVDGVQNAVAVERCRAAGVDALRGNLPPERVPSLPATQTAVHGTGEAARVILPTSLRTMLAMPAEAARELRPGELQCLVAMHLLHQEVVDLHEVGEVIDTDPVMTMRVLHLVNSSAYSLRHGVDTAQHAVVLLGIRQVTTLIAALTVDTRPDPLDSLWVILARALTVESLADDPVGYTVGMLSALITELGVPADVVLDQVGVSALVADAVRDQTGPLGVILAAVLAHERNDPTSVLLAGMAPARVSGVYVDCLADALATVRTLHPQG